jgi:hypothetical protein
VSVFIEILLCRLKICSQLVPQNMALAAHVNMFRTAWPQLNLHGPSSLST